MRSELEKLRLKKNFGFSIENLYWFVKKYRGPNVWRHVGLAMGEGKASLASPPTPVLTDWYLNTISYQHGVKMTSVRIQR